VLINLLSNVSRPQSYQYGDHAVGAADYLFVYENKRINHLANNEESDLLKANAFFDSALWSGNICA
jgi:hypothetical protein